MFKKRKPSTALLAPYQVDIEEIVNYLDVQDEAVRNALRFLLHSACIGTSALRISDVAGISANTCIVLARRARRSGIWVGRKVAAEWVTSNTDSAVVALIADALVLTGKLRRIRKSEVKYECARDDQ